MTSKSLLIMRRAPSSTMTNYSSPRCFSIRIPKFSWATWPLWFVGKKSQPPTNSSILTESRMAPKFESHWPGAGAHAPLDRHRRHARGMSEIGNELGVGRCDPVAFHPPACDLPLPAGLAVAGADAPSRVGDPDGPVAVGGVGLPRPRDVPPQQRLLPLVQQAEPLQRRRQRVVHLPPPRVRLVAGELPQRRHVPVAVVVAEAEPRLEPHEVHGERHGRVRRQDAPLRRAPLRRVPLPEVLHVVGVGRQAFHSLYASRDARGFRIRRIARTFQPAASSAPRCRAPIVSSTSATMSRPDPAIRMLRAAVMAPHAYSCSEWRIVTYASRSGAGEAYGPPRALNGMASLQDPTGSASFRFRSSASGRYSHTSPSRATSSRHLNRFGAGKHRDTTSTCAAAGRRRPWRAARRAVASCRCSRATSLDQLAARPHGSFTATTSYHSVPAAAGSGRSGHDGAPYSSSSSIHSGYRCSQVTFFPTGSRRTVEASVCGSRALHSSTSPASKLSNATRSPPPSSAGATCSFTAVSICDQSIFRLDAYPEFGASGCDIQLAFDASGLSFPDNYQLSSWIIGSSS
uniref:Uncharacterized protein n=1 Tax=Setaria italica TaxID=4555 RepID=K3YR76_SETIT